MPEISRPCSGRPRHRPPVMRSISRKVNNSGFIAGIQPRGLVLYRFPATTGAGIGYGCLKHRRAPARVPACAFAWASGPPLDLVDMVKIAGAVLVRDGGLLAVVKRDRAVPAAIGYLLAVDFQRPATTGRRGSRTVNEV